MSQKVLLKIKDYGDVKIELDETQAPITVQNFIDLVKTEFYDGLIFHRIVKNFVIQGGDPTGTGMGGSKNNIKGEFEANGVKNNISHTVGTISMARSMAMDSASSQFFICTADATFLDKNYAGFGKVIEGLDVILKVGQVETKSDRPVKDVVIESIRLID